MGISNLFDIASSGITTQRLAMEVAGENVANVNTEGYSRQTVVMTNRPVNTSNGFPLGTGVEIQTVQRTHDDMLQQQIVSGNSSYQQSLAKQTALQQIEPSFNELTSDGLGKAMDDFFGAWQDLSANAGGTAERQALLSKSQNLVETFHQVNTSLTNIAQSADSSLSAIADEVSQQAQNLAQVNAQIQATQSVGGNPNELFDQRDLLLQKMAEKVGITSTIASDGTATVNLPLPGGEPLVAGTKYALLYTGKNSATPPTNDLFVTGINTSPAKNGADINVTSTIGGPNNSLGQIGGVLQVRDDIVPGYLASLDDMAANLASSVNAIHATGYGTDGSTGNNFFAGGAVTSANIGLDPALTVSKIAAALPTSSDPAPTSSGNNVNALKIADIQNSAVNFSTGKATFADFYNSLAGKVGTDTQSAQNATMQGQAFLQQLNTLRQSNSGVSLDEELTNLTRYQQAFQGSAKLLTMATEMMDTVLGLVQ